MQVTKDIEVVQLPFDKPLGALADYRPFSILLFEDTITFRDGNNRTNLTISDGTSNSLFPRDVSDCDYDLVSSYVSDIQTLCIGGRGIRVYNLGEIDGVLLDTILIEYTKQRLGVPFSGAYIEYRADGTINNTWAGIYVLVNHPTQVYACHYSDFLHAPSEILNYCFEDASQKGYNIFVDSGICINSSIYSVLLDAAYSFGHAGNGVYASMFFAINTPFSNKIDISYAPTQKRYNIIVFTGHTIMKLDEVIHGYIPVSALYGSLLGNMSKMSKYYSNASNKPIYFSPLTSIDLKKKDIDAVNDLANTYKINVPYIYSDIWYLGNLRTTEDNVAILKIENNARIIVDTNIALIANMKSLLGRQFRDEDELEKAINGVFDFVRNNMRAKTDFILDNIKMVSYKLEGNSIKVDFEVSLATSIEKIYLSVQATI
jgi:hypothetical protein